MATNFFLRLDGSGGGGGQLCYQSFSTIGSVVPVFDGSYSQSIGSTNTDNPEFFDSQSSRDAANTMIASLGMCSTEDVTTPFFFACPVDSSLSPDPVNFPWGVAWYCCTSATPAPCSPVISP